MLIYLKVLEQSVIAYFSTVMLLTKHLLLNAIGDKLWSVLVQLFYMP